ncbi:Hypothetical_protein [Hexamita inflata]|uniref:Hypothetical_protein n=1 Tax=Hexamita inflata TaxID=28002 RepID=A0AA86URN8_9EUKA|nr:Hypothetical protein HINF_LOCUS49576 [Hexamita inflata]
MVQKCLKLSVFYLIISSPKSSQLQFPLISQFYLLPLKVRIVNVFKSAFEQVTVAHKNIVLNSVDLYRDFYEGLRAIDCQSVAKAKNEEPKEVELFGWYGNLKK